MLLREVESIFVGGVEHVSEQQFCHDHVAAADHAGQIEVNLILELGFSEQQLEDMLDLRLLPGQILNNALNRDLAPPELLALKAIVEQDGVALLAGFGEMVLPSLGLEAGPLDHLLHVPRAAVVVGHVAHDGEQLL